jgi:hypothetical protein
MRVPRKTPPVNRPANGYLFSVVALLLGGCASPPSASEAGKLNVWVVRWDDVRAHRLVHRMAFAKNDLPTPVVQNAGWKEQRIKVEIVRQETDSVVFQTEFPLGRNETKHANLEKPLPAGTYHLKVTPQASAPIVQNFSVYGY